MEVDKKSQEKSQEKRKLDVAGFHDLDESEEDEEEMQMILIGREYFKEIVTAWCEKEGTKVLKTVLNASNTKVGKK